MTKKPTPSPTAFTARDGRRVVMWAEPHDEPKLDIFISALLAYALAQVEDDESEGKS
jgi:hypothetical protein